MLFVHTHSLFPIPRCPCRCAVPFTPSQGVCGASANPMASQTMFSPFSSFQRGGVDTAVSFLPACCWAACCSRGVAGWVLGAVRAQTGAAWAACRPERARARVLISACRPTTQLQSLRGRETACVVAALSKTPVVIQKAAILTASCTACGTREQRQQALRCVSLLPSRQRQTDASVWYRCCVSAPPSVVRSWV